MDSLKKLQAKVTQLKQSATNLTHKKSLSTSSKKSRDKAVRHSRSMPLDPVSLEPEVWTSHPRAQYKGKTPLKTSDIRVITRPEDQKIPPPYAPLKVKDVQPEEEEYSDEDWYPGPTPPPKDIVFQFPRPPKTVPKRPAKQTTKQGTSSSSSSTAGKQKPVPVPVPVPVAAAVPVPAPSTPSPTPSTPPSSSCLPKPVDSPLRKEDLLPPPPKAMFEKMQRQAEARRPKNLFGPLQAAPSYEEIADFVMRSDPSPRSGSPGAISPETELGRDRLREAIRRRKAQHQSGGSSGGSSSNSNHNRPGHLPTPSTSSAGSSGAVNVGVLPTTAPLEIRRTRSTGAANALSPPSSSAPQPQARKGATESWSSLPQQQQQRQFGMEDAQVMTRNHSDPTAATLVALRQHHYGDEDEYEEQDNSDENVHTPELPFGPLSTLNRLPISPPASPPPSNYSSPAKGATNSGRGTPSSLASNERIRLKEVRYYQHGGPSSRPESPLSLNLQQKQQAAHSSNHSRQWSDGPRYKLDASTSSIVLDTSNISMGSLSAGLGPGSGFGIGMGMGIEQSDSQATAMSRRSSSNGSRSNHNSNSNSRSGGSAAGSRPALAIGKQQAQQLEQLRHRHYPTPSNSSASASSFRSSGNISNLNNLSFNNPNLSTSSDSAISPASCYPPSPPPKKPRQLQGTGSSGSGGSGKGFGAQTMSSTYKSAVPAIGFMSPADRVVNANANVVTPPSSNQGHGLGLRRANTAVGPGSKERLPVTPRRF